MAEKMMCLPLTLDAVASSGVVFSSEMKAALEVSLPLKKAEAGLDRLELFGKITTTSGKDYLVAYGVGTYTWIDGMVNGEMKAFYSQDGVSWMDLEPVSSPEDFSRLAALTTMLTGDPSAMTTIEEPVPGIPAESVPEGEEPPPAPEPTLLDYSETQRLYVMVASISAGIGGVVPKGVLVVSSESTIEFNPMFAGLKYPDKLESYVHTNNGPLSESLASDVRGSWALVYDAFAKKATLRSLVYPGYVFYYSAVTKTFGGLYLGPGVRNMDLVFML